MTTHSRISRTCRGSAMVEYLLLVMTVALFMTAGVSQFTMTLQEKILVQADRITFDGGGTEGAESQPE